MQNVIKMALKLLQYFCHKKLEKLPSGWRLFPLDPLCDTLELHQFVQHGAQLENFCAKKIYFWSKPPPLYTKNPDFASTVAFTVADRFFKRLCGPDAKRAKKRYRPYTFFSDMNAKLLK